MKISCTQENLNQGLFVVSHIASKNSSLPILNNILFQVHDRSIKLMATDLELGVSCVVRGKVEEMGDFTVQSKLLADYINLLPKERVDLSAPSEIDADQVLAVSCGSSSTKIKGQNAGDFPVIPEIEKTTPYVLDYKALRQALSQVIFAVSANETRPEINGVLFSFSEGILTLAATDSYRLAEKKVSLSDTGNQEEKRITVPARTLQELMRIMGSLKDPSSFSEIENVSVYVSDNQILFVLDSIELVSRLVDGRYPDYTQIIPQESKTVATLDVAEFSKAVKATSLFARSGIYDVHLGFDPTEGVVTVSSTNTQLGESTSSLTANCTGETNNVVVNYRYLLDGLSNSKATEVELKVINGDSPVVLLPLGKESNYTYIIMPIKQ